MMENRQCWCILLSYRLQPALPGLMAEVMVTLGRYNPHLTLAMALARVRPGSGHDLLGPNKKYSALFNSDSIRGRSDRWTARQTCFGWTLDMSYEAVGIIIPSRVY